MNKFYTFQPVLVRNSSKDEWCPDFLDKEIISNLQKKAEDTQIDSGCDLQCGDLVAVRDSAYAAWSIRIFSHIEDHRYICFKWSDTTNEGTGETFAWRYCVPLYLCQPVIFALIGNKQ